MSCRELDPSRGDPLPEVSVWLLGMYGWVCCIFFLNLHYMKLAVVHVFSIGKKNSKISTSQVIIPFHVADFSEAFCIPICIFIK